MSAASCHDHRGRAAVGLVITALLGVAAGPALAHVVYGTPPLSLLTQESDLVARVRIIDPHSDLPLADPLAREIVVVAEVLELLKGSYAKERVRFVQHGHGSPEYQTGEEAAVFLKRIERTGYEDFLFLDWRYLEDGKTPNPDLELNAGRYQGANILLARRNFGCG